MNVADCLTPDEQARVRDAREGYLRAREAFESEPDAEMMETAWEWVQAASSANRAAVDWAVQLCATRTARQRLAELRKGEA